MTEEEIHAAHIASMFLNTLTPKFYVALTGTSSLISGLILIFEWWYFRKYGTSFIEQFSLNHLSPWFGANSGAGEFNDTEGDLSTSTGANANSNNPVQNSNHLPNGHGTSNCLNSNNGNGNSISIFGSATTFSTGGSGGTTGSGGGSNFTSSSGATNECKVWRNPLNLFRGAEYNRYHTATGREPLTYYDMNLSAQDHQTFFTCDSDAGKSDYEIMQIAWRERDTATRIKLAKDALQKNSECPPALILLAEEEASTIIEAEKILRQALKFAENNYKISTLQQSNNGHHHGHSHHNLVSESTLRRDTNLCVYIRRRLAMCLRKLGKYKECIKMMRDLIKEFPNINVLNIHENLIEVLLEMQAYADVQALLIKYDDISMPKSATICYTAALLKARVISDKFSPEIASKRGLNNAEMSAVEAIHRAVEFNPHVPKYLLEMKSLVLPPEHILKRGDSEALAYSFFHINHWKRIDGALNLLHCTWEGTFRLIPYPLEKGYLFYPYPQCTESADKELLPPFHEVSVYPKKELPFFILFTAGLCSFTALLALLTHQYPEYMGSFAKMFVNVISVPCTYVLEKVQVILPSNIIHHLSRI
ncbi:unnamed protein product [Gordionus sp. m RMFG-2023]|uniref:protein ST7 homolog isoform X2 n=1 Tax=Gordionus sp. m RMFG-2023 TaxID=3053472 RepID=UPI0030E156B5